VLHYMYIACLVNYHIDEFIAYEKSDQNLQDLKGHWYHIMQNAEFALSWFAISQA
jgi:hypothetical protein